MPAGRVQLPAAITADRWNSSGSMPGTMQNSQDRAWPCGQLKPNELGLFDMLGNVYEWCQEQYDRLPRREKIIRQTMI